MNKWTQKYSAIAIFLTASALSVAAYYIPLAPNDAPESSAHMRMVLSMGMVTYIIGGALLFLQGAVAFKAQLQRAYRWFAGGLFLFGLAMLQWPVLVMIGQQDSFWSESGLAIIPFVLSAAFMYYGMQQYAKLLGVRSRLISWKFALSAIIIAALASGLISYLVSRIFPAIPEEGTEMYIYTAVVAWSSGFGLVAAILAYKVRSIIGASYRNLMTWMVVALGSLTVSGIHEGISSIINSENSWYTYSGASVVPFVATGVLLIVAGYMFNKERTVAPSNHISVNASNDGENEDRIYIDSITTIAQLASRPNDIDPILDGLRQVTSRLQPGTKLTNQEHEQLLEVYRKLEEYLVTSDPLQKYESVQLRNMLAPGFRQKLETQSAA